MFAIHCWIQGIFTFYSTSCTLPIPDITKNYFLCARGLFIGLIQLIFFILLVDYFENSQITISYQEKLQELQILKSSIEISNIDDSVKKIDNCTLFTKFNIVNIYNTTRRKFLFFFHLPIFSINSLSIEILDKDELKKHFNYVDEKLILLTDPLVLLLTLGTFVIFGIVPMIKWFFSSSLSDFVIVILFVIAGGLLLRIMKMLLPPAFTEKDSFSPIDSQFINDLSEEWRRFDNSFQFETNETS